MSSLAKVLLISGECRYQAIVRDYKIASMKDNADGTVDCRISNENIDDDIAFEPHTGAVTYIRGEAEGYSLYEIVKLPRLLGIFRKF